MLEIVAAILGVTGTLLLAIKSPYAGWAFVAYLISNVGWIAFGSVHGHWALVGQHVVFSITSLIGIWVWIIKPCWFPSKSLATQADAGANVNGSAAS